MKLSDLDHLLIRVAVHRVLEKRYRMSFRTSSGFELGSTNCRRALVAERRR